MAWKKIIVQSSAAELSNINVTNAVTASKFVGDGSGLTDITVSQDATVSQVFSNVQTSSVVHNFDSKNVSVVIYDENDEQFIPTKVKLTDNNTVTVHMDPATTGRIHVVRGGHVVSGSIPFANIITTPTTLSGYGITDAATTTNLNLKADIASPTFTGTVAGITSTMVGLGNVDNTSDANKPVSTAAQTEIDTKADIASPTFTGTVAGISKGMVGLGSVDNTSDADKPVSTAQQTEIDTKADLASPTFTGTVAGISSTMVGLGNVNNTSDADKPVSTAQQTEIDTKADLASPALTGNPTAPTQADNDNSTKIATTAYVQREVSDLLGGAPAAFDTLLEISASIANGDSDVVSLTTVVGGKLQKDQNLSDLTNAATARGNLGLGNVDNTSDADKPISTAAQSESDTKADIASPTFTGTVSGVSKGMVGLGNVDNTTDANKPVSTAGQTALDLKADIDSPTFTGTVSGISKTMVGLGNADNTSDANKPVSTAGQTALDLKANLADPTFTGTVAGITSTMVGLGNVDNTSDANKPVSTAGQTALDLKADLASPTFTGTVAGISKTMVGLGNVDNTTDANKPISTATQTALDDKSSIAQLNASSSTLAASIAAVSSDFTIAGGSGTDTFTTGQTLTFAGTANEIETAVTNNQVQVGIVTNPTLTGNVTITGDLNVTGDTIQAQVSNLNVEDKFILLNSGSASGDAGIVFGGAGGSTANTGDGIFYKDTDSVFAFGENIASNATSATVGSKLGNIQVASSDPSAAPTFQGKGTIAINDSDDGIWIYS